MTGGTMRDAMLDRFGDENLWERDKSLLDWRLNG